MKSLDEIKNDFHRRLESVSSQWYSALLFKGTIDLIISPPLNVVSYLQMLRYLENSKFFHVLSTSGNFEEDSISSIKIHIREPYPLFDLAINIPGIQDVRVLTGDELVSTGPADSVAFISDEESDQKCQILLSFYVPASRYF